MIPETPRTERIRRCRIAGRGQLLQPRSSGQRIPERVGIHCDILVNACPGRFFVMRSDV